ncbi:hypothetical protein ACWDA8_44420, partial [Streptomyces sp. NPDC001130]
MDSHRSGTSPTCRGCRLRRRHRPVDRVPRVLGLGDDGPAWRSEEARHPPLVTNDSHYTYAHEATAHDAPLCIQTGKNLSDPDPFKFDGTGYYLKSTDEMHAI